VRRPEHQSAVFHLPSGKDTDEEADEGLGILYCSLARSTCETRSPTCEKTVGRDAYAQSRRLFPRKPKPPLTYHLMGHGEEDDTQTYKNMSTSVGLSRFLLLPFALNSEAHSDPSPKGSRERGGGRGGENGGGRHTLSRRRRPRRATVPPRRPRAKGHSGGGPCCDVPPGAGAAPERLARHMVTCRSRAAPPRRPPGPRGTRG